ncbi:MAG: DNA primase [Sulfuritalea sp.]|nr:DNA primase [Sulfuritalea sp.]
MSARDKFLALVDHKRTGPDHGLFRVPTRSDRNMSGTWRELDDGRLLLHDFGGDSVHEIVAAVGLSMQDLFPEPITGHARSERRAFPASDCLRAVAFEGTVMLAIGAAMMAGEALDRGRLVVALERVNGALSAAGLGVIRDR